MAPNNGTKVYMTEVFKEDVVFKAVKRPMKNPTKDPLISKQRSVKIGDLKTVIRELLVERWMQKYIGDMTSSAKVKRSPVVARGDAQGVIQAEAIKDEAINQAQSNKEG